MFFRMVYKSGQIFLPFCHNARVRRTDGRTDGQTHRILLAIPCLHYMQRGKRHNHTVVWASSWLISYFQQLFIKNSIVKRSETLIT